MGVLIHVIAATLSVLLVAEPTTQPEWRAAFDRAHGLAPGEVLKHVLPPFPDERMEFYANAMPDQAAAMPGAPTSITVEWDTAPQMGFCHFGPDDGKRIDDVARQLATLRDYQLDASSELLEKRVIGDWTRRKGAKAAEILPAFAKILSRELDELIDANEETIEEEAVIVTGVVDPEKRFQKKEIKLPLDSVALHQTMRGAGPLSSLLDQLGCSVGYPVIDATEPGQFAFGQCEWGSDDQPAVAPPEQAHIAPEHLDVLLKSISEQTGLKFRIEPRKITRWHLTVSK